MVGVIRRRGRDGAGERNDEKSADVKTRFLHEYGEQVILEKGCGGVCLSNKISHASMGRGWLLSNAVTHLTHAASDDEERRAQVSLSRRRCRRRASDADVDVEP